jgi:glutamyl/glutaminyl-tRNA synthetase
LPRRPTASNGRDRLEEAIATLIQNQAAFVASHSEAEQRRLEMERRHLQYERETADSFAQIKTQMAEIIRVLNEHGRILTDHGRLIEHLTDAVREKIGFKGP